MASTEFGEILVKTHFVSQVAQAVFYLAALRKQLVVSDAVVSSGKRMGRTCGREINGSQ